MPGNDLTHRFPQIVEALARLPATMRPIDSVPIYFVALT
jgi:hypothetical protein